MMQKEESRRLKKWHRLACSRLWKRHKNVSWRFRRSMPKKLKRKPLRVN